MRKPAATIRALIALFICFLALGAVSYKVITTRSFQLFGAFTQRVDTEEKKVALTFDDGPTCSDVEPILRSLEGTPATFFVLGSEMEQCPQGTRALVHAGHELGNHTWSHRRMIGVTPQDVAAEIEPTDARIRAAGYQGEILFRPPYGNKFIVLPLWLQDHHRHTATWDVSAETYDGRAQTAEEIANETIKNTRPGSIILLHPWEGRTQTQKAIPLIIRALKEQGYTFVTASELING